MSTSTPSGRPIAVVRISRYRKILDYIEFIKLLILNFTNNVALLPSPVPTVANMTTENNALETANTVAGTRVPGAVAARNVKLKKVKTNMWSWLRYVQELADAAPDTATAIQIIESAGFAVRLRGVHIKPTISATYGEEDGEVIIRARAADEKRAGYEWQQSNDGLVWTTVATTLQSHVVIDGLTAGQKYYFRVRAIIKTGPLLWTGAVSIWAK